MTAEREQHGSPPAHATGAVQFIAMEDIALDESFRLRADGDVSQLATAVGRLGQLSPVELRPWPGAGSDGPQWQIVSGFRRLAAVRMLARDRVLARLHQELGESDAWGLALTEALLQEPLTGVELEALREKLRASGVAPWAEDLVDEALVRAPVPAELRERFYDFLSATGEGPRGRAEATEDEGGPPPGGPPAPTPTVNAAVSALPTQDPGPSEASTPTRDLTPSAPEAASERGEGGDLAAPPALEPGEGAHEEEYVEVTPDELAQDLIARLSILNQDLATAVEAWKDLPVDGRRSIVDQARYVAALLPFMEMPE